MTDDVLYRYLRGRDDRAKKRVAEVVEGRSTKAGPYYRIIDDAFAAIIELAKQDGRKIDLDSGCDAAYDALWDWINRDNDEKLVGDDDALIEACSAS